VVPVARVARDVGAANQANGRYDRAGRHYEPQLARRVTFRTETERSSWQ
jgi:hypothetical protein